MKCFTKANRVYTKNWTQNQLNYLFCFNKHVPGVFVMQLQLILNELLESNITHITPFWAVLLNSLDREIPFFAPLCCCWNWIIGCCNTYLIFHQAKSPNSQSLRISVLIKQNYTLSRTFIFNIWGNLRWRRFSTALAVIHTAWVSSSIREQIVVRYGQLDRVMVFGSEGRGFGALQYRLAWKYDRALLLMTAPWIWHTLFW